MLSFGPDIPFVHELGFVLVKAESGESELHYAPRAEHLNSFAIVHGGALMTLMDVTMAMAARSVDFEQGALTIEMKTSFMQAANGPLVGKGQLLHRTGSMAFTESRVYDQEGRLCVQATGTFKYMKRKVKEDGSLHPQATD
ncbi:PaaI family thioesterase [Comamonas sp. Y33R10-2]|uniref:PaaI family thioesterase n=1 Tax=Comamonas sp. Y33R10-2 TaxID=2853257 RepID=UPI001C5C9C34|nr:PaaI family thioesterase [Comamonas sp. Y33R10-2]QXZ11029.1 PaaI family thioesterase [Comamonas sp. Y33R10-2]